MLQQALYMLASCEFMLPLCGNLQIAAWSPIGSASACMAQMMLSNIMVIKARSLLHSCMFKKSGWGRSWPPHQQAVQHRPVLYVS